MGWQGSPYRGPTQRLIFAPSGAKFRDSDGSHVVTLAFGNESADRTLNIPALGGDRTMALLEMAQTFTNLNTIATTLGNTDQFIVRNATEGFYFNTSPGLAEIVGYDGAAANSIGLRTGAMGVGDGLIASSTALIWNENGANLDVRFEGDTNANLFFVDASTDRVGIGTATPAETLEVAGNVRLSGGSGQAIGFLGATNVQLVADATSFRMASNDGKPVEMRVVDAQPFQVKTTNELRLEVTGAGVLGYLGTTTGSRLNRKPASQLLSAVSGATVTATGLIPAGAILEGVVTRIVTGLGATLGTTGYAVGDAGDPNRWGDVSGVAAGTISDADDFTADPAGTWSAAARDVILTAAGGNFDGTGAIRVTAYYRDFTAPTS